MCISCSVLIWIRASEWCCWRTRREGRSTWMQHKNKNDRCVVSPLKAFVSTMVCLQDEALLLLLLLLQSGCLVSSSRDVSMDMRDTVPQLAGCTLFSGLVTKWCCSGDADTVVDGSSFEGIVLPVVVVMELQHAITITTPRIRYFCSLQLWVAQTVNFFTKWVH